VGFCYITRPGVGKFYKGQIVYNLGFVDNMGSFAAIQIYHDRVKAAIKE
jgi:hypothetical protein